MTDNLTFNVAQLLREPVGATRPGQVVADLGRLAPELAQVAGVAEGVLSGSIRLMHTTGGVLVQGDLTGQATLPCARCLEPVVVPLNVALEEIFVSTIDLVTGQTVMPEEEDRALWIDEHHILDLTEVLRQDVLLAAPLHVLCRDECRGLCPICGQNLNDGLCACQPEPDPRWAALTALLPKRESSPYVSE
jgi:uncharacterized protein